MRRQTLLVVAVVVAALVLAWFAYRGGFSMGQN